MLAASLRSKSTCADPLDHDVHGEALGHDSGCVEAAAFDGTGTSDCWRSLVVQLVALPQMALYDCDSA